MPIRDATPDDAPAIARIHVDSWRETYRGLMPEEVFPTLSYEGRERQWRAATAAAGEGRGCVVVADDGEAGIVGFACGGACRGEWGYDGELFAIYLPRAHQGRGLGKALFLAVAGRIAAQGKRSMLLWVLENNAPARGFYEALGGVPAGEKTEEIVGATIHEVAYGWPSIDDLLTGAKRT